VIRRGVFYRTPGGVTMVVLRMAKDKSWADIEAKDNRAQWRKRQPLRDGCFPFEVSIVNGWSE
jgi:hypothetical protein